VLVHGLGGNWRSWRPILDGLAAEREVIAIDLPGHGDSVRLPGTATFAALTDATSAFLREHGLANADLVGSSMGARLVLELARRGVGGSVVSLDPGGFWSGAERVYFGVTLGLSIRLVRLLQPVMPLLTRSAIGRTALFAQLSAKPWRVPPGVALEEMQSYARTAVFDELLSDLARGPGQEGMPSESARTRITIAWGRSDRVCPPGQAARAMSRFPDAELHWFEGCGHFPQWDAAAETISLILSRTGSGTRQ